MPLRRPETRYHGRQQYLYDQELHSRREQSRPYHRFRNKYLEFLSEPRLSTLMHRYSQRTTPMPYVCTAIVFAYFGTLFGYY